METQNLYKVTLKGMTTGSGVIYGVSYVVASNTDIAYRMIYDYLDINNIGFRKDRVLDKIELIAEGKKFPDCQTKLFIED